MTHQKSRMGRKIHPEDTIRFRRRFTLLVLSMIVVGAFPPAAIVLVPAWIAVLVDERRRRTARYLSDNAEHLAHVRSRGREQA